MSAILALSAFISALVRPGVEVSRDSGKSRETIELGVGGLTLSRFVSGWVFSHAELALAGFGSIGHEPVEVQKESDTRLEVSPGGVPEEKAIPLW